MFDSEAKLKLHLIYSPLPSFSLHALNGFEGSKGKVFGTSVDSGAKFSVNPSLKPCTCI